jgi:hypothetical protein
MQLNSGISGFTRCPKRVTLSKGFMNVVVEIPDELASRLSAAGVDLSQRALEALVAADRELKSRPGSAASVTREIVHEGGLLVLRTGQPIDPAVIDRTLGAIRDERDLANLGITL